MKTLITIISTLILTATIIALTSCAYSKVSGKPALFGAYSVQNDEIDCDFASGKIIIQYSKTAKVCVIDTVLKVENN